MRLIDADVFKAYMRGALEQTRRCYPDGGEWAEAVTEEFCRDIDEQPTVQPDHNADIGKKVPISCAHENDLISRQAALKELAVYIHMIDKTMGKGTLTGDDCMEAAKSVLGEDELPTVQPETATVTIGRTKGSVVMWYECDACGEPIDQKDCYCRNCGRKLTLPEAYRGGDTE